MQEANGITDCVRRETGTRVHIRAAAALASVRRLEVDSTTSEHEQANGIGIALSKYIYLQYNHDIVSGIVKKVDTLPDTRLSISSRHIHHPLRRLEGEKEERSEVSEFAENRIELADLERRVLDGNQSEPQASAAAQIRNKFTGEPSALIDPLFWCLCRRWRELSKFCRSAVPPARNARHSQTQTRPNSGTTAARLSNLAQSYASKLAIEVFL